MEPNGKGHLFRAEGTLVIILALGYLGLTAFSLWKWNEAVSGALITGFAIFAQKAIGSFFDLVSAQASLPSSPTSTTTTSTITQQPKQSTKEGESS